MPFQLRQTLCLSLLSFSVLATAQTTDLAHKKAALKQACAAGVLTPDECKQRLAALTAPPASPTAAPAADALAGGQLYHDPNGRFTLTIPPGWTIDASQGSLKITNGDAWARFDTATITGTPINVAISTAQKMEQFVTEPKVLAQGDYTTAGNYPAAGLTAGCMLSTKTGPVHRVMLFNAISAGNDNYVIMMSSADYDTGGPINALLSQVIDSIRFAK
jgi:hypothetical protein